MIVEAHVTIDGSKEAIWAVVSDIPNGSNLVTMTHESKPQRFIAKVMSAPMGLVLKGMMKKALLRDLHDVKAPVERVPDEEQP